MIAWRAFRNMLRAAARDPVWAIIAIALAPFRVFRHLFGTLIILGLVIFCVDALGAGLIALLHLQHSPIAYVILGPLLVVSVFVAAFRLLTGPLIQHFGDRPSDTHGSARFATDTEAANLTQAATGLLIGRDIKTGRPLRYAGPAHLLTMAPTRSGKGVGTLIPNLLTANRSVICIDPKGENARITGRARNRFGPVHVLDPFEVTGLEDARQRINVLGRDLADPIADHEQLPGTALAKLFEAGFGISVLVYGEPPMG